MVKKDCMKSNRQTMYIIILHSCLHCIEKKLDLLISQLSSSTHQLNDIQP